ncbi:LamG domain-containing protein [bacterium]|nr:LamG domain-containing protein [bacterium]
MTKARILANLISDNAELADGQISVAEVVGAAPLASPTFTGTTSGTFSGPLTGNVTGNLTGNVTGAVTGDVTAPEIDLSAISSTISDTAVDVFVYDTSKDSDGGAWRKRTQGTSWYNETLNTATRGSRKEFPAVAVIVAESNQVTIYDGDDPDMPMWMVFTGASYTFIGPSTRTTSSVAMLNGILCIGRKNSVGYMAYTSFIDDSARAYSSNSGEYRDWLKPIVDRNTSDALVKSNSAYAIVNDQINDVAMTVLPNAPIDAATGLPVPTIAIASDGGVSVIKDDGTVVDLKTTNTYTGANKINFTKENKLAFSAQNSGGQQQYYNYVVDSIPSSDETFSNWRGNSERVYETLVGTVQYSAVVLNPITYTNPGANVIDATPTDYGLAAGFNSRLTAILETSEINNENAGAYITSTYNTGWMNGNIKLATLSDTDDTDVTGSELVTNGTFDSDVSGWSISTGSASSVSGRMELVNGQATQSFATVVGETYVLTLTATNITQNGHIRIGTAAASYTYGDFPNYTGDLVVTFKATTAGTYITLYTYSLSGTVAYDNVSVRLAEEDRSVNGNGLQVFGTVTKNPVATGADLVAYSGFSTSNYLAQPYNSDIDVGTGDFSFTIWAKADAFNSYNVLFANWWVNQSDAAQFTLETVGSKLWFYVVDGGQFHAAGGNTDLPLGVWNQITVTRKNSLMTVYINGVPESTTYRYTGDLIARTSPLSIGVLWSATGPSGGAEGPWNGSLALFRASATAPSPEQIKKIYEDEKVLFQENAQATLYGSSDAVTALAYDDSTELLHVGTSAGRSVFQGLRRVDNTTDAVGAAISASNGLVAED